MTQGRADSKDPAVERCATEALHMRAEVEALLRQARVLLRGEAPPVSGRRPIALHPKRLERDQQLEIALERADWHRREIRRLRADLENREKMHGHQVDPRDRDPMELHNLLVEKRKELQRIQRNIESMEHVNEVQRRAEVKDSALRPEVYEKLQRLKMEVELHKRHNIKLQADRLKVSGARKAAEDELRVAKGEQRTKALQLQRPPRPNGPAGAEEEPTALRALRRDVDVLRGALRQDERRFKATEKEDTSEVEFAAEQLAHLQKSLTEKKAVLERLKTSVQGGRLYDPFLEPH